MSIEATSWVFKHSPYEGCQRLVHLAIADVANDDYDYEVWLGLDGLAKKARCSKATVATAIKRMRQDGLLRLVERGGGRGHRSTYQMVLPGNCPADSETVQSAQETVQSLDTNRARTYSSNSSNSRKYQLISYSLEEEEIWKAYPKREGQNPKKAGIEGYRKWLAAGIDHPTLLAAVQMYAESRPDPEYTMMARTFFGPEERWRDFLPSDPNKSETPREITPVQAWTTYDEGGWYLDGVGMTVYDEPPVPRPSPGAPVAP